MRPHQLRDDQWDPIRDKLPGRAGSVGATAADNRLFVDAVIHRYRTGIPWRDLPETFGNWNNTHRRWSHWAKRGVWDGILALLVVDADKRVIESLEAAGKIAVIPPKTNRLEPRAYDKVPYEARHLMENFFCWAKQFRAIATRYGKTARNFLAAVHLVAALCWLN